jgi:restriction system protein
MSGYTFEKEIENLYKKIGFEVNRTKYSGDGGVDLILYDSMKNKIVVQCKNHKNPVGPSIVRELYGVMISEDASKAVLICSGGFTEGVFAFARNKNIELLDLNKILELSRSYQ